MFGVLRVSGLCLGCELSLKVRVLFSAWVRARIKASILMRGIQAID